MGRQLSIVATPNDERELLTYIQTLSPIRIYVWFKQTVDALWIDDWEYRDIEGYNFNVWLQAFPWVPEYRQTGGPRCPKDQNGLWYVSNRRHGPVIEISRPTANQSIGGRLYWDRDLRAPTGLGYDTAMFERSLDRIWSWIRRNAHRRVSNGKPYGTYYLPEAWARATQGESTNEVANPNVGSDEL